MTRLLVVGAIWPEPKSSAAGAHILQVLRPLLRAGWDVTYASTTTDSTHAFDLSGVGVSTEEIQVNAPYFDELLQSLDPDVVIFDRFFVEEQFGWRVEQHCPNALRILNCEDLHCLREARERALSSQNPSKLVLNSRTARREVAAILRSDLSLIISQFEIEALTKTFQVDRSLLHYSPFMVDPPIENDISDMPRFDERRGFFTVGNFRHAPNWDATRWLKAKVWPLIRKRIPDARLSVAGAYASPVQMQLHAPEEGFYMEGRIDEIAPHFLNARICLAPLRFGAGLKGKLIDAMTNGTPIVTTPIGAEGLSGDLPWAGSIKETEAGLASAAAELYSNPNDWTQAQSNGFAILQSRFDRRTHEPLQIERFAVARETLIERRDANFVGAMLRDHHHRSTRYLSLWIEAKNRLAENQS
jgi:glycosyltransferase involved in cell wall biosynthesis